MTGTDQQLLLGWADRHNGTYRVGSFFQFAPTTYIRADSTVTRPPVVTG
jgi:hypothetical protein